MEQEGDASSAWVAAVLLTCAVLFGAMLLQWLIDPQPPWGPIEKAGAVLAAAPWVGMGLARLGERWR